MTTELEQRLSRLERRKAKTDRAIERAKQEIEAAKAAPKFVTVAGIEWELAFLTPSDNREEKAYYNEETGLWYFDQEAAILHAYEQNKRIATSEHYRQLFERTTFKWVTRKGLNGMLFTDKETGAQIFFPASGCRDYSAGSFHGVGRYGYYWSGSVYDATHGFYLGFYTTAVYPQDSNARSFGFPVRCVSEIKQLK